MTLPPLQPAFWNRFNKGKRDEIWAELVSINWILKNAFLFWQQSIVRSKIPSVVKNCTGSLNYFRSIAISHCYVTLYWSSALRVYWYVVRESDLIVESIFNYIDHNQWQYSKACFQNVVNRHLRYKYISSFCFDITRDKSLVISTILITFFHEFYIMQ